tara:strand:+ start:1235 stop:1420 length:186 start_codon:yes stop_codon:yes gene_type:complete
MNTISQHFSDPNNRMIAHMFATMPKGVKFIYGDYANYKFEYSIPEEQVHDWLDAVLNRSKT